MLASCFILIACVLVLVGLVLVRFAGLIVALVYFDEVLVVLCLVASLGVSFA